MNTMTRTVIFCTLLASASFAFAGPEHARHGKGNGPNAGGPIAMELAGAIKRLDLSDEQRSDIKNIFEENRDAMQAHGAARRALEAELATLLNAPELDDDALADLAKREGALAEERVLLTGTLAAEVQAQLDEDQRLELVEMRNERSERRDEARQDRMARRANRGE